MKRQGPGVIGVLAAALLAFGLGASPAKGPAPLNDVHFHLTNYIQEGTDIHEFLKIMGDRVGRVAMFGIPLQQQWSARVSGTDKGPTYYLESDAPLYYYSFTDAAIAMAYKSLTPEEQARFDPMITGFNPTDMYAVDHIRRVLKTFPGVFSGIGEFTIHKEFVSAKIRGEVASLTDPALDRILDFAGEAGLVVLIHNDMDTPFPKEGAAPAYFDQMKDLLKRHDRTTIIWAHIGLGRIVRPASDHLALLESLLAEPAYNHVYFDISWTETAKYIVASPAETEAAARLMNKYPDRFLFGTDEDAGFLFEELQPSMPRSGASSRRRPPKKSTRRTTSASSTKPARTCASGRRRTNKSGAAGCSTCDAFPGRARRAQMSCAGNSLTILCAASSSPARRSTRSSWQCPLLAHSGHLVRCLS